MQGIIEHTPPWVWALLVLLILVGLRASRTRATSAIPYYVLPALVILAAQTVSGLAAPLAGWIAFVIGYAGAAFVSFGWQDGLVLAKAGHRITVRGEWLTLVVMIAIFGANFALGALVGMGSAVVQSTLFAGIVAAILGAASGHFAGRAVRIATMGDRG